MSVKPVSWICRQTPGGIHKAAIPADGMIWKYGHPSANQELWGAPIVDHNASVSLALPERPSISWTSRTGLANFGTKVYACFEAQPHFLLNQYNRMVKEL
ncbi:hypothetical protein PAXINDRAFT_15261 [Paxillus involutus ATCC 200175]|uniref:Uncharacterized protein n=1 Tax=Paxillus involutus ATCC 200175 TaxID=664439 RepID=A0A0C9ST94_PAXIN|nr:hypothetical protein PAXINDRAFT_15261 [Paxillus involutus ATCC 200175]